MREGLTYSDVLIMPGFSDILTRDDIDIKSDYLGGHRIPIISSPMDFVTGYPMAKRMHELGAYGIVNRFGYTSLSLETWPDHEYGLAIGLKQIDESIKDIHKSRPHSICIDVAHGHHALVAAIIKYLREKLDYEPYIIVGNIATSQGFEYLAEVGANAIRIGIGPGSACSTRETTGVGVPQLSAIMDCATVKRRFPGVSLIADGGINTSGDILKALAAGADAVMLGKMLAGHDETPGDIIEDRFKRYRGQSLLGTNGERGAPEGIDGLVDYKGPVDKTIQSLVNYMKSGFSYVGARDIQDFRRKARFIKVSAGTQEENKTRL